jgi:hypothetical protein
LNSVVKANCRARFTAADFDFVVRTLSKSPRDAVSLVRLLSDVEERDAILDHEAIADAILSQNSHLCISSAFYFYVLTRRVLRRARIEDRVLCDYLASVLDEFTRTARLGSPTAAGGPVSGAVYLSDLLLALREASPAQAFLLRAHVGNYTLFLTGIFPDNIERRRNRLGAPGCSFYEEMGRMSYRAVAGHAVARAWGLTQIFHGLAEQFHEIRVALNQLADRLLTLDDDAPPAGLVR